MVAFLAALVIGATAAAAQPVAIPTLRDPAVRAARPAPGAVTGIRFVTTDDFPPFNFVDAGGRLTGFNVDLARAICSQLGVPCTIQSRPFDDLLPSLVEQRADAAIAGISVTAEARTQLGFTQPYLPLPARFVVRKALPLTISAETLAGRRVAVAAQSAHLAYLEAYFPGAAIRTYPTADAARSALRSGQADVAFGDAVQLAFWLQGTTAGDCCEFAGGAHFDEHFFGRGLSVATSADAPELIAAMDWAIEAAFADGTFTALYLRYFPVGFF
ncbi:MAG: transporter substrate-binding domain-containing protein [Bauldia sp.]|nr:transporter substrate-binding domain-containing protein [Bauldia sp.]